MQNNYSIKYINLSGNNIGYFGVKALATVLKTNFNIETLILDHNNLCDVSLIELSKALKTNYGLKVLSLAGNNFSDLGNLALAESLSVNTSLISLKIDFEYSNNFYDKVRKQVINNFILSNRLLEFNIKDNNSIYDEWLVLEQFLVLNENKMKFFMDVISCYTIYELLLKEDFKDLHNKNLYKSFSKKEIEKNLPKIIYDNLDLIMFYKSKTKKLPLTFYQNIEGYRNYKNMANLTKIAKDPFRIFTPLPPEVHENIFRLMDIDPIQFRKILDKRNKKLVNISK